jgi:hypothetical protein
MEKCGENGEREGQYERGLEAVPILHEPLNLVERLIVLLVLEYYCLFVFLPGLSHGSMLRRLPVAEGKTGAGDGASSRLSRRRNPN